MARIQRPADLNLSALSLVPRRALEFAPPSPRPMALLSPLEQALVARDESSIKTLLLAGADPRQVCPVWLGDAIRSDGADCARLIQVARRMKQLNICAPALPAISRVAGTDGAVYPQTGLGTGFTGRFAQKNTGEPHPGTDGPITRALANYDIDTATTTLRKPSVLPEFFAPRRHRDRLLGTLALNETDKLAIWHEKGLLNPAKAPADDPALKRYLKQFSHRKLPSRGRPLIFLNGKTKFENTNEKIVCRHLAVHWLLHRPRTGNGKIDYAMLSNKKNLQKAFETEHRKAFEYYTANCTNSHMVENDHWGRFLASQFREMQGPDAGTNTKKILITSINHAMACELSVKKNAIGRLTYAVDFYDPNITNAHRRVRAPDMATIESLSMKTLINNQRLTSVYYKNQSLSMAFVIDDGMAKPQAGDGRRSGGRSLMGMIASLGTDTGAESVAVETIANRKLSSRPAALGAQKVPNKNLANGSYVFQMMQSGFSGELDAAFTEISRMPDKKMQMAAMSTPRHKSGPTPLIQAMVTGFEHSASAFTAGLLAQDGLSSDQKTQILSYAVNVKRKKMTGLQAALILDDQKIVGAFTRLVLASEALSDDQKCKILDTKMEGKNLISARPFPGTPIYTPSGKAFRDAVMCSSVPPTLRARLLDSNQMDSAANSRRSFRSMLSALRP